jgi:hypothetical protein
MGTIKSGVQSQGCVALLDDASGAVSTAVAGTPDLFDLECEAAAQIKLSLAGAAPPAVAAKADCPQSKLMDNITLPKTPNLIAVPLILNLRSVTQPDQSFIELAC